MMLYRWLMTSFVRLTEEFLVSSLSSCYLYSHTMIARSWLAATSLIITSFYTLRLYLKHIAPGHGNILPVRCSDSAKLIWDVYMWMRTLKVILTLADAPLSNLNNAQKVQKPFFCCCFVFWHNQYVAPPKFCQAVCLERNPVRQSIFIQTRESYWHLSTSWRNRIILSAVYRVSSPATLPVLHARELAKREGCRVNHGVMKQIYSGLQRYSFSD